MFYTSDFEEDPHRHETTRVFCPLSKMCFSSARDAENTDMLLFMLISYCPQLSVCVHSNSLSLDSQLSPTEIILHSVLQHLAQEALAPRYTAIQITINENK